MYGYNGTSIIIFGYNAMDNMLWNKNITTLLNM